MKTSNINGLNQKETIKVVRKLAKNAGLTFKAQATNVNGLQGYQFTERLTGIPVMTHCTLNTAYNSALNFSPIK